MPAFHHSAELPPDHDLDEYEGFVDNCNNRDYDYSDGQGPTVGAFPISGGFVSGKKNQVAGRVQLEVLKYSIRHFRVPYLLSGISEYAGYFQYFGYLSYT